jgi:hypothetical protein
MSEQDGSAGGSSNLKGYLGLAAIVAAWMSFAVQPEQSRICEDENGFDYISATCEHPFFLARLFSPSYCSVTYQTEGGRSLSSFSEPAKRIDTQYHFAALEMIAMTFDPDLDVATFESRNPLFIEVDFEKYTIETKGAFSYRFNSCRRGDY